MIQLHSGRWRWVILLPHVGIVLKIPRWYPIEFARCLRDILRMIGRLPWSLIRATELYPQSAFIRYGFGGVSDNIGEWRYYRQTRHPFLQPTYISLFGLLNVQRYGRPLRQSSEQEVERMHRWGVLTEWAVYRDAHTFGSDANFCLDEFGHIRIVDYGQTTTQRVLRDHADTLCLGYRTALPRRSAS